MEVLGGALRYPQVLEEGLRAGVLQGYRAEGRRAAACDPTV